MAVPSTNRHAYCTTLLPRTLHALHFPRPRKRRHRDPLRPRVVSAHPAALRPSVVGCLWSVAAHQESQQRPGVEARVPVLAGGRRGGGARPNRPSRAPGPLLQSGAALSGSPIVTETEPHPPLSGLISSRVGASCRAHASPEACYAFLLLTTALRVTQA